VNHKKILMAEEVCSLNETLAQLQVEVVHKREFLQRNFGVIPKGDEVLISLICCNLIKG